MKKPQVRFIKKIFLIEIAVRHPFQSKIFFNIKWTLRKPKLSRHIKMNPTNIALSMQ